jgi:hypothetical protein
MNWELINIFPTFFKWKSSELWVPLSPRVGHMDSPFVEYLTWGSVSALNDPFTSSPGSHGQAPLWNTLPRGSVSSLNSLSKCERNYFFCAKKKPIITLLAGYKMIWIITSLLIWQYHSRLFLDHKRIANNIFSKFKFWFFSIKSNNKMLFCQCEKLIILGQ